jgi:hypothetical protein
MTVAVMGSSAVIHCELGCSLPFEIPSKSLATLLTRIEVDSHFPGPDPQLSHDHSTP